MHRQATSALILLLLHLAGVARASQKPLDEARALQQKGAVREAQKAYEALLPQLRASDPAALGAALNALSQIASSQGDHEAAIARAREATTVYRALGDRIGEARAVYNIGVAELYRGDHLNALRHFREALSLARSSGDREREIEALNNIGSAYYLQASYLEALRAYREAMERVGRAAGEPWSPRLRRITLTNLAALFQRLGQEEQALQLYGELQKSPGALGPSEQARLLINLGVLYRRLDDPLKALETYRAAQRLLAREEQVGHLGERVGRHDAQISVLKVIGIVQALDLGNLPSALEAFSSALALAEKSGDRREAMQAHLYRGEALYRLGEGGAAEHEFQEALAAAKELGTTEEQWKALYGLGRLARAAGQDDVAAARFREAIAGIESVRARLQLAQLKTDFLADKREVYEALVELLLQRPDTAEIFNLLERGRARTFQDRFAQAPPTLAAVQARLDAATVLLEFWVGPPSAAVLWVTRDGSGIAPLPASAADLREISSFMKEVSDGPEDAWKRSSAVLGDRLLAGILPLGRPETRHLIVVPDGPLGALPFELLGPGSGPLLVERFDVSYLPSAVVLLRDPPRSSWAFPWKRQLLAFADPRIAVGLTQAAAEELGGAELNDPLPASADEVRAIARTCRGRAQLYLGKADLKSHLLEGGAAGVPLLHLSTHATADTVNPERSRILFSPAGGGDRADYLFLKEVYDLDLRGVDLATLSACDTERGKTIRGEGLQGFSRALLSAGSRSAVTTLWRVGDEPTREFMKLFYTELNHGQPKAQALRLAKLRFLRSGTPMQHPRFWAAFILTGEGLRPIPRVLSWSVLLGAAGLLVLACAVGMRKPPFTKA